MHFSKKMRRLAQVFAVLLVLLSLRLFFLSSRQDYKQKTAAQTEKEWILYADRGRILDRAGLPLTDHTAEYVYFFDPNTARPDMLAASSLPFSDRQLKEAWKTRQPLILRTSLPFPAPDGLLMSAHRRRYQENQPAAQLIGYIDEEGHGISGLEQAFDRILYRGGPSASVRFEADATGGLRLNGIPTLKETSSCSSLTLTLDSAMQEAAEHCLRTRNIKGCVLISDCRTGEILVMASSPTFSPIRPGQFLNDPDSPFLNRALFAYDAGSIFKIITTAAALESGYTTESVGYCGGYYDAGGKKIACANRYGHGWETLETAFKESCNPYFCGLAVQLGPDKLLQTAKRFGLGSYQELAPGFCSASGNLPQRSALQDKAALALFGFGQGSLQVTPLQMLQVVSTVANDGIQMPPKLILRIQEQGKGPRQTPDFSGIPVISKETARTLRSLLKTAVSDGSGSLAASPHFSSCGKTGTAETGWKEEGKTMVHGWFVGFFPAERPRYSMVVFCENGRSGAAAAAPVFKELSEWIWFAEQKETP